MSKIIFKAILEAFMRELELYLTAYWTIYLVKMFTISMWRVIGWVKYPSITAYREIVNMRRSTTVLAQMTRPLNSKKIRELESKYKLPRAARILTLFMHLKLMVCFQLAACESLRALIEFIGDGRKNLKHIGIQPVGRSTLADANEKRTAEYFLDVFHAVCDMCEPIVPQHKFRFKNKLHCMDATVVSLASDLFRWAPYRTEKSGIKINVQMELGGCTPLVLSMSSAKTHEGKMTGKAELDKGDIIVFDRGYNNYSWFRELDSKGVYFVTRLKDHASFDLIERRKFTENKGVTSDHIIKVRTRDNKTLKLRKVRYIDAETKKVYVFLTNNFNLASRTIADIYKERWKIEVFFRTVKQNLRIKHFVGNSENAVLIQIYTAMIAYLLTAWQKFQSKCKLSIQQILRRVKRLSLTFTPLETILGIKPPDQNFVNNSEWLICVS